VGLLKNEDIVMEPRIESVTDYVKYYQGKWRSHVNRMDAERFPKANFMMSTSGEKFNRTTEEEMERKSKTVTGLKI
jgi:hypothetical protein